MTKDVRYFDIRLSWLFSPDKITMKCSEEGTRYIIEGAKNGRIELHAVKRIKPGVAPYLDIFGRFENGSKFFKNANPHTGKYNFFGLDEEGIAFYLNTVLSPLSNEAE